MVSDNLRKAVGKTQAQKVLTTLADKGLIASKGDKAKIYWKKQVFFMRLLILFVSLIVWVKDEGEINEDEVKEMDASIANLQNEITAASSECSRLASGNIITLSLFYYLF